MAHFSRLTDIITCNLSSIIDRSDDPARTLNELIAEMEEGVAGARRSVATASRSEVKLAAEIAEQEQQVRNWTDRAKQSLLKNDDHEARLALLRKREVEDLLSGLRPELDAAQSTHRNLLRTLKALEARHADAIRRKAETEGKSLEETNGADALQPATAEELNDVETELEALRKELRG